MLCWNNYLNIGMILFLLYIPVQVKAQVNTKKQILYDNSIYLIEYLDNSVEDAEMEQYDIMIIDKISMDTSVICHNIPYIDSNAVMKINHNLLYITHNCFVRYDIEHKEYDTILNSSDHWNINSFMATSNNIYLVALVNYIEENIALYIINTVSKQITHKICILEKNIGLEYLRISFDEKNAELIKVKTNQREYNVWLKEGIYTTSIN